MVIGNAVNNLKQKPQEDKKAVAGGIATLVVIVLLVGWAFFFFKKIQRGGTLDQFGTTQQAEFDFSSVRKAQAEIPNQYQDAISELERIRESSLYNQQGTPADTLDVSGSGSASYDDPFQQLLDYAE